MSGNTVFASVNGVLYTKDMNYLINYPAAKNGNEYHVPAQTVGFCCTSFASSKNLRSLYLEGKDTIWMTYTFYNTGSLTVYYHPGGRAESRAQGFINEGLSYESNPIYCRFREYGDVMKPDLVLPENLQTIGNMAFSGVKDSVIYVPGSVKQIGDSAFDKSVTVLCPSGSFAEKYCNDHGIDVRTE